MDQNDPENTALKNLFDRLDTDNDGKLHEAEIRTLLSEFDIDESFAPALIKIFSGDGENNQAASFADITEFISTLSFGDPKDFFERVFNAMDSNRHGYIDENDLISFSSLVGDPLSQEEAKDIIAKCSNQDQKVRFDDFWQWYSTQHED